MIESISIKDLKLELGALCKQKRKSYDLSQEDLAVDLGLSRFTIQKFENGKNSTLDTVFKIANHFELLPQILKGIKGLKDTDTNISLY